MPNKQVCVRTYPDSFYDPTKTLNEYLNQGYKVVMCNRYIVKNPDVYGNEYILAKEENDNVQM